MGAIRAHGPVNKQLNVSFLGADATQMVWYGILWFGMVWFGIVWYGMVWYGMVWYGWVWYGLVWYGLPCNFAGQ